MASRKYASCKVCGRRRDEVGPISHQRLCGDCAVRRKDANNDEIHAGSGPYHLHRLRRMLMHANRELLDAHRAGVETERQ